MKKIIYPLILVFILVSALSGCGSGSNVKVKDEREIEVEKGTIHSISPDGKLILSTNPDRLFFYDAKDLDEVKVVDLKEPTLDPMTIQWSPDSKHLTFTQNYFLRLHEPDIFLVDVEKGKVKNLTDDDVDDINLRNFDPDMNIDVNPVFKDTKTIMFVRFDMEKRRSKLFEIDIKSGDEKELTESSIGDAPNIVTLGAPSSGKKAFFTYLPPNIDDRKRGIWFADYGKDDKDQILRCNEEYTRFSLASVSDSGDYGLIFTEVRKPSSDQQMKLSSGYQVINLKTGDMMPLLDKGNDSIPITAAFSPDGKSALCLYREKDSNELFLSVTNCKGGNETILWNEDMDYSYMASSLYPGGLNWAKNNTVFIATASNKGIILELGK